MVSSRDRRRLSQGPMGSQSADLLKVVLIGDTN